MLIEATSDTHFPVKPEQFKGADVLVVAGDLLLEGTVEEMYPALNAINALPHARKVVVLGNHDRCLDPANGGYTASIVEQEFPGIIFLGYPFARETVEIEDKVFLGLPFVTNLPRWAFNRDEYQLYNLAGNLPKADIVVSHSPPKFVRDGAEVGAAWGVAAWHRYLNEHNPELLICGHIHESYGEEIYEGCRVVNVANCDTKYDQVNLPRIIDV